MVHLMKQEKCSFPAGFADVLLSGGYTDIEVADLLRDAARRRLM